MRIRWRPNVGRSLRDAKARAPSRELSPRASRSCSHRRAASTGFHLRCGRMTRIFRTLFATTARTSSGVRRNMSREHFYWFTTQPIDERRVQANRWASLIEWVRRRSPAVLPFGLSAVGDFDDPASLPSVERPPPLSLKPIASKIFPTATARAPCYNPFDTMAGHHFVAPAPNKRFRTGGLKVGCICGRGRLQSAFYPVIWRVSRSRCSTACAARPARPLRQGPAVRGCEAFDNRRSPASYQRLSPPSAEFAFVCAPAKMLVSSTHAHRAILVQPNRRQVRDLSGFVGRGRRRALGQGPYGGRDFFPRSRRDQLTCIVET